MSREYTTAWLKSGEYLPDWLRDFHDQKDFFKALDEVAQRSVENGNSEIKDISWRAAHIFTVDIFLWMAARHGYTLQRSHKRKRSITFDDLFSFITDAKRRRDAQSARVLGLALSSAKPVSPPIRDGLK